MLVFLKWPIWLIVSCLLSVINSAEAGRYRPVGCSRFGIGIGSGNGIEKCTQLSVGRVTFMFPM